MIYIDSHMRTTSLTVRSAFRAREWELHEDREEPLLVRHPRTKGSGGAGVRILDARKGIERAWLPVGPTASPLRVSPLLRLRLRASRRSPTVTRDVHHRVTASVARRICAGSSRDATAIEQKRVALIGAWASPAQPWSPRSILIRRYLSFILRLLHVSMPTSNSRVTAQIRDQASGPRRGRCSGDGCAGRAVRGVMALPKRDMQSSLLMRSSAGRGRP